MANATKMGERLLASACVLMNKHRNIGDVRGRGLMVGMEFVKDRGTREPHPELVQQLVQRSFRQGLLLLGAGKSSLRLAPPLIIDEHDLDTAMSMIDTCLGELA
jgi:4-aminobutyrate aminotransferase